MNTFKHTHIIMLWVKNRFGATFCTISIFFFNFSTDFQFYWNVFEKAKNKLFEIYALLCLVLRPNPNQLNTRIYQLKQGQQECIKKWILMSFVNYFDLWEFLSGALALKTFQDHFEIQTNINLWDITAFIELFIFRFQVFYISRYLIAQTKKKLSVTFDGYNSKTKWDIKKLNKTKHCSYFIILLNINFTSLIKVQEFMCYSFPYRSLETSQKIFETSSFLSQITKINIKLN